MINEKTPIWVVTDPGPCSTLPDIYFETTLDGLRLQFLGGLTMAAHPTIYESHEMALEDAKNRLLVWKVARQVKIDRRLKDDEVVRVVLHDADGKVLFDGEVR